MEVGQIVGYSDDVHSYEMVVEKIEGTKIQGRMLCELSNEWEPINQLLAGTPRQVDLQDYHAIWWKDIDKEARDTIAFGIRDRACFQAFSDTNYIGYIHCRRTTKNAGVALETVNMETLDEEGLPRVELHTFINVFDVGYLLQSIGMKIVPETTLIIENDNGVCVYGDIQDIKEQEISEEVAQIVQEIEGAKEYERL